VKKVKKVKAIVVVKLEMNGHELGLRKSKNMGGRRRGNGRRSIRKMRSL